MPLDAPRRTDASTCFDFASRLEAEVGELNGFKAMLLNLPDREQRADLCYLVGKLIEHHGRLHELVQEAYKLR